MLDLNPGDRFAGCQIISMCGRGGYGTVYLAEDGVGRRVALKLVSTVDKRRELEGIRAYMKLASTSKYLLPIRHVGIERDELFYIMDPADPVPGLSFYLGDTLGKRLRQHGRLDPSQAIDIIRKTASAVRELHQAGFIHRDIKPENIFPEGATIWLCNVVHTLFGTHPKDIYITDIKVHPDDNSLEWNVKEQ